MGPKVLIPKSDLAGLGRMIGTTLPVVPTTSDPTGIGAGAVHMGGGGWV